MIIQACLVSLAFLICVGVDRLMSWQTFGRPLVAGTITGLVLGDLRTGIIMGGALEAIFMGMSPIGGSIPSDAMTGTIIPVAYTIISGTPMEAGIAMALPIGTLMSVANELYKPVLASFSQHWENLAASGNMRAFRIQLVLFAVIVDRLHWLIIVFLSVAFGVEGLQSVFAILPPNVMSGLKAASGMMTGVGFAILLSMIWNKEVGIFFIFGFILAKYLQLPTLAIALLALVVAVVYFYNDKKLMEIRQLAAGRIAGATQEEEDFF